jgi:hypothetical protein
MGSAAMGAFLAFGLLALGLANSAQGILDSSGKGLAGAAFVEGEFGRVDAHMDGDPCFGLRWYDVGFSYWSGDVSRCAHSSGNLSRGGFKGQVTRKCMRGMFFSCV